jgi:hypothetical protein
MAYAASPFSPGYDRLGARLVAIGPEGLVPGKAYLLKLAATKAFRQKFFLGRFSMNKYNVGVTATRGIESLPGT